MWWFDMATNTDKWFVGQLPVSSAYVGETKVYPSGGGRENSWYFIHEKLSNFDQFRDVGFYEAANQYGRTTWCAKDAYGKYFLENRDYKKGQVWLLEYDDGTTFTTTAILSHSDQHYACGLTYAPKENAWWSLVSDG
jgi:hypothetical protein